MFRIFLRFLFVFFVILPADKSGCAQEDESTPPDKPKSYTERYLDFYTKGNFSENYQERYKTDNYRKYYQQLHYENYSRGYGGIYGYITPQRDVEDIPFDKGNKLNSLPHHPEGDSQNPTTSLQYLPGNVRLVQPGFNPFFLPPDKIPPHLLHSATSVQEATCESLIGTATPALSTKSIRAATPDPSSESPVSVSGVTQSLARPDNPAFQSATQMLYQDGVNFFSQRNYEQAESAFQKLVEMVSDSFYAQFAYGVSLFYQEKYDASLNALQKSFQIAKEKNMKMPSLWQLHILPADFRFHLRKLARYAEETPQDADASTLFLLLSNAASGPMTP